MSNYSINEALVKAAEAVQGRSLTQLERSQIVKYYDAAMGTRYERALEAISVITKKSRIQINEIRSASDNTDRIVSDLLGLLNE